MEQRSGGRERVRVRVGVFVVWVLHPLEPVPKLEAVRGSARCFARGRREAEYEEVAVEMEVEVEGAVEM